MPCMCLVSAEMSKDLRLPQEHGMRLLICICYPLHRIRPRWTRYDLHHRPWKRNCTPVYHSQFRDSTDACLQVCAAIKEVARRLVGKSTEDLFADMGATWNFMMSDPQLRWSVAVLAGHACYHVNSSGYRIGPEKGVIHIASGAVNNALWDMYARQEKKPLWKLVVDFTPVRVVSPGTDPFTDLSAHRKNLCAQLPGGISPTRSPRRRRSPWSRPRRPPRRSAKPSFVRLGSSLDPFVLAGTDHLYLSVTPHTSLLLAGSGTATRRSRV